MICVVSVALLEPGTAASVLATLVLTVSVSGPVLSAHVSVASIALPGNILCYIQCVCQSNALGYCKDLCEVIQLHVYDQEFAPQLYSAVGSLCQSLFHIDS